MNWMFLTQVGGILKPFAWIMGMILNAIYKLVAAMGIQNIALCIVVFTIVVKMITLPLTIKQQKFAKVSALMTPEIKALQEKYKNIDRTDREAMQRYTMEQQAIYQKYGSSPLGGCLPLLIMLPIIFALYRVIYAIPAYVTDVNTLYKNVATDVTAISKEIDFTEDEITKAVYEFYTAEGVTLRSAKDLDRSFTITDMIDVFSVYNTGVWEDFRSGKNLDVRDKNGFSLTMNWNMLANSDAFKKAMEKRSDDIDKILKVNGLGKYSILDAPGYHFPAILLPILAFLLQYLTGKLNTMNTKKNGKKEEEPMPGMGAMNTILPVMSGVFCIFMPIGVGIYWVVTSAVTIVQQLSINKYLDRYNVEDIVAQNEAKVAEHNEKYGIYSKKEGMSAIAKSSTKSIATMDTSKISTKKSDKDSTGRRSETGRVSQEKKDELSKKAAENGGSVGIAAIANILKNDEDQ
ncbi:MAG: YidC/Oxa1 family membrane protein insertase [Lachnospiraceae bacterium]|nr:YidC/Oxa1 family membrane protein insertase [Lachnospiraceae bacterium]